MAIGIGLDDTPICWDSYFEHLFEMEKFQKERQEALLDAKDKAHAAIKEFLNGAEG